MTLNPAYITNTSLNQYFVDKETGAPLSGGKVYFYQDTNRTNPKLVYELSGSPPNYTYSPLPNPITLSGVGTVQDDDGNNVSIYYYPYDANGDLDFYYIVVKDASGAEQFTREAWPNEAQIDSEIVEESNFDNQISNPQFVDVFFTSPLTLSFSGTGQNTYQIAPDWQLQVSYTGTSFVTITRTSITGSSEYPTNAPYTVTFTVSNNITSCHLVQTLPNTSNIWAPATDAENGFLSFGLVLANMSGCTVQYVGSSIAPQTIFTHTNTSGQAEFVNQVTQLNPGSSPDTGATGSVQIVVVLPVANTTTITSLQLFPSNVDLAPEEIQFNQITPSRQRDQLFHYYGPQLAAKPTPSYLVGWDFPLNPAQPLGNTVSASSAGANTSSYVWDQTICFQTVNNGFSFSRAATGALTVTCAADGQFALVQYLDARTAIEILSNPLSVNVLGATSITAGLTGTVSLWYTTSGSLPSIGSNASIVSTLDANGLPATVNGSFVKVPTNLGQDNKFTLLHSTTNYLDVGLTGWNLNSLSTASTATYFAIVVGFSAMEIGDTATFESISLVPGNFPTRPAPKSVNQVLSDCQRYYSMSFPVGTVPAQNVGSTDGAYIFRQPVGSNTQIRIGSVNYPIVMRSSSPNIVSYNWHAANQFAGNATQTGSGVDFYNTMTIILTGSGSFSFSSSSGISSALGDMIAVHWTADARLGVV